MDMLTPKFYDFNFLIRRKLLNVLTQATELYFEGKENLEIVDVGYGDEPYFQLFEKNAQQYIGIDMKKSDFVDIIGSAEKLPFIDNYFDVALSTRMLIKEEKKDLYAYKFKGKRYDVGDKLWYVKAIIDFALEMEDLREEIKRHL